MSSWGQLHRRVVFMQMLEMFALCKCKSVPFDLYSWDSKVEFWKFLFSISSNVFFLLWIMFILLPPSRAFSIYRREIKKERQIVAEKDGGFYLEIFSFWWRFNGRYYSGSWGMLRGMQVDCQPSKIPFQIFLTQHIR